MVLFLDFLLKLILSAVSVLSNLLSQLIFSRAAHLLMIVMILIHGFKLPGQAIHVALQEVREIIKSCVVFLMELVMEAISALVSTFFDYLKEGVVRSAAVITSAIGDLLEKTKTSLEKMLRDICKVFEGLSVSTSPRKTQTRVLCTLVGKKATAECKDLLSCAKVEYAGFMKCVINTLRMGAVDRVKHQTFIIEENDEDIFHHLVRALGSETALKAEVLKQHGFVDVLTRENGELKCEVHNLQQQLEIANSKCHYLESDLAAKGEELAGKDKEFADKVKELADKDRHLTALEAEIDALRKDLDKSYVVQAALQLNIVQVP